MQEFPNPHLDVGTLVHISGWEGLGYAIQIADDVVDGALELGEEGIVVAADVAKTSVDMASHVVDQLTRGDPNAALHEKNAVEVAEFVPRDAAITAVALVDDVSSVVSLNVSTATPAKLAAVNQKAQLADRASKAARMGKDFVAPIASPEIDEAPKVDSPATVAPRRPRRNALQRAAQDKRAAVEEKAKN